jgi:hypothetical protein
MPELAKDTISLLSYLLPGFLAAWVLYGLTSNPKPGQFERVIEALIFTFFIHVMIPVVRGILEFLGKNLYSIRPWDATSENICKLMLAISIGVFLAVYTNNDGAHKWLRKLGITTRNSFPSEWVGVFSRKITYIVLHLKDGRRLYGWPREWPNQHDKGHFYIQEPSWILQDGSQITLENVDGLLVSSSAVEWVEFMAITQEPQDA